MECLKHSFRVSSLRGQNPQQARYQYGELPEHCIRVLHLNTDSSSTLSGRLKVVKLSGIGTLKPVATLMFNALSFTWHGSDDGRKDSKYVICDGTGYITITPNLQRALRRIVNVQRSLGVEFLLWVDQVCINQTDVKEKSKQIMMMGDIYRAARIVLIYLGEPPKSFIPLLEMIHYQHEQQEAVSCSMSGETASTSASLYGFYGTLRTDSQLNWMSSAGFMLNDTTVFRPGRPKSRPLDNNTYRLKTAISRLLSLNWYDRVWTFQEVVLASKPLVIYGALITPWSFIQQLSEHPITCGIGDDLDALDNFKSVLKARMLLADGSSMRGGAGHPDGLKLSTLMYITRMRRATEARDKVFGVIGLLPEHDPQAMNLPESYSAPVMRIYQLAAEHCLLEDGDLEILGATRRCVGRTLNRVPSWVPDWTNGYREPISKWIRRYERTRPAVEVCRDALGDRLKVTGILLDRIKSCSATRPTSCARAGKVHSIFDLVEKDASFWRKPVENKDNWEYRDDLGVIRMLFGSLPVNRPPFFVPSEPHNISHFARPVTSSPRISVPEQQIIWQFVETALESRGRQCPEPRTVQQFAIEGERWLEDGQNHPCMNEKVCFATNRAVGIGPDWAKVGDVVCWFGGSTVLHLIRPVLSASDAPDRVPWKDWWGLQKHENVVGFGVVGECYVRDLMNLSLDIVWQDIKSSDNKYDDLAELFIDMELV